MRIAVVGAGVIGMTSALAVKEAFPSYAVTIFADLVTPNTTGDGSAGLWGPYLIGNNTSDDIHRWAGKTFKWMEQFWKSDVASEVGVSLLPLIRLTCTADEEYLNPIGISLVYGGRKLSSDEIRAYAKEYKKNYSTGWHFLTYTCEPGKLLPWLTKKFTLLGGNIKQRKIQSLTDLHNEGYEVVINCSGLGAIQLANDSLLTPIRGQVFRVAAPWVFEAFLDDDNGSYVIPNMESVILGGTRQKGDFDRSVREDDSRFIHGECNRILPGLKNSKVLKSWVGLRPGRSAIRLEAEISRLENESNGLIIHNYGHGGSGVTLCWGCALDVVEILRKQRTNIISRL